MFGASSADVVSFLANQRLMPDLSGRSVVLVGLGDTADPQPPLAANLQTGIVDLWTAVATKAGAVCAYRLKAASTRTAVTTNVPVTVVKPPVPQPFTDCGTTVLADSGSVGFVVGTGNFRDPEAARKTLESLAQTLVKHTQRVTLTGTTSSEGSAGANQTLSEQRANAVKAILVQLGVEQSRITAVGVGSHGPNHQPDMTKDGVLIPAAAAHNRSVVVTLTCQ
jgi:outer membrane protein OmpA-like peptidoglycan-associated protein